MATPVTREELLGKLRREDAIALVEALGSGYFADAHLPGAMNIPPDQVDRLAPHLLPDTNVEVIVYCSGTCENAAIVARRLADLGYEHVGIYSGGKADWVEHGLPVERP
jgi:rhodanese-related sulfurtransferase